MEKSVLKRLCIIILALSSIFSLANARFFIGIDGGYSIYKIDVKALYTLGYDTTGVEKEYLSFKINKMYSGSGSFVSANIGTEHYFDEGRYVAFRWLLSGKYGRTKPTDHYIFIDRTYLSTYWSAGLGIDFLFDVIKLNKLGSIGFFVGVNAEYMELFSDERTPCTQESFNRGERCAYIGGDSGPVRYIDFENVLLNPRVGTSVFLADHHRLEFRVEIPISIATGKSITPVLKNDAMYTYRPIQFMLGYKFVF